MRPNDFRGSEYDQYDCALCAQPVQAKPPDSHPQARAVALVDHVIMFKRIVSGDGPPQAVCVGCLTTAPAIALRRVGIVLK